MAGLEGYGFPAHPCEGAAALEVKVWMNVHNHPYVCSLTTAQLSAFSQLKCVALMLLLFI